MGARATKRRLRGVRRARRTRTSHRGRTEPRLVSVGAALGHADVSPSDSSARERIRHDLASTIFVQAAAGSGKTAALVARVTSLIDHGLAELREIAAISFTE